MADHFIQHQTKVIPLLLDQFLTFPLSADHFILFEEIHRRKFPCWQTSLVSELPCWRTGLYDHVLHSQAVGQGPVRKPFLGTNFFPET